MTRCRPASSVNEDLIGAKDLLLIGQSGLLKLDLMGAKDLPLIGLSAPVFKGWWRAAGRGIASHPHDGSSRVAGETRSTWNRLFPTDIA